MTAVGSSASDLNFEDLPGPGDRFKLGSKLGSGVTGKIYEANDGKTGRKVAVKVINLTKENETYIREEYRALRDLPQHENLPEFYGIFLKKGRKENEEVWLVMELCEGGTVIDFVQGIHRQNKKMNELHIAYFLYEIVKGIVQLHENRTVHRDIRGRNVLLTKDGHVKLIDFGLSVRLNMSTDKLNACVGSPGWLAPEVITCESDNEHAGYDNRVDVWALGITAIELGDGRAPFQDIHPARALFQIVRNPPPTLYRPANWSQLYNDFIIECLEKNYENRPFVQELLEHPFFENVKSSSNLPDLIKSLIEDNPPPENKKPDVMINKRRLKIEEQPFAEKIYQEDLAALEQPTEDSVLNELHERHKRKQFHTFVGDVLIVVNPNENHQIYGSEYHRKYQFKARSDNAPHIYSVADSAYQDVLHNEEPQHILLAGETLSGKTTNMLNIMDHLLFLGQGTNCIEKIEKAVKVIHALGNAETPHNPNSTRNLLQTQLTFTATGKVSGAIFWLYLLEKTRVTTSDRKQINFHLFYYFYDAIKSQGILSEFKLEAERDYRYLRAKSISTTGKPGPQENLSNNTQKFAEFESNLRDLQFEEEHVLAIKDTLSAILLLGEISFEDGDDGNAKIINQETVKAVAHLLGIDEKKISWALLNYCIIVKGEAVRRRQIQAQARESTDVLARGIYFRLVDWIVNNINKKLAVGRAIYGDKHCISIMDLFGFECYAKNSLEQLFVNSINEQLQFHYNQRMFVWEMQNAEEEEIPMPVLHFYDNKPAVDQLMSKAEGLFHITDEASRNGGPSYLLETIESSVKGPYITVVNTKEFSVAHYTGKVTYDVSEISDKNRDFLPPEMIETMRLSSRDVITQLFTKLLTKTGNLTTESDPKVAGKKQGRWSAALVAENENRKGRKYNTQSKGQYSQSRQMRTASTVFRATCLEILKSLTSNGSGIHFVRCIRADLTNKPGGFQQEVVRQQIRALAVLDTARARQLGYSQRIPFTEFIRRYKFLAFDFDENVEFTKENCRLLLVRLKMEGWAIGKTKVFLKYFNEEYLSRLYEIQVKKIVKVQSMMRTFIAKRSLCSKIKNIQKKTDEEIKDSQSDNARKKSCKLTEEEAAKIIQKEYRGHVVRKQYGPLIKSSSGPTTESETFVREWYKKWRARSIFQVLLMYRAKRHHDLVYFCQQTHLYNQNLLSCLEYNNIEIEVKEINTKTQLHLFLPPFRPFVHKLPFRLSDLTFFDKNYICDPIKGHIIGESVNGEEAWDSPVQRHVPDKYQIFHSQELETGVLEGKINCGSFGNKLLHTPFNREQNKPVGVVKFSKQVKTEETVEHRNYIKPWNEKQPPSQIQPKPFVLNSRKQDDSRVESPYRQPLSVKNSKIMKNPIKELEEKCRRSETGGDTDDPPFNFQAMLRKTNHIRASLKRKNENLVYSSDFQNDTKIINSNDVGNTVNNNNTKPLLTNHGKFSRLPKSDNTILTELVPGLVVQGEIADL